MASRVDQCIEEAEDATWDCHLRLIPLYGGWGGVGEGILYYRCMKKVQENLLECDRKAKRDTHCPDTDTPADCTGEQGFTVYEPTQIPVDAAPPPARVLRKIPMPVFSYRAGFCGRHSGNGDA